MKKAIIRIQKLKSPIAIRRSMLHSFREQDTPNADPKKLSQNESIGANSTSEGLAKLNQILPEKVRKNAVLAVASQDIANRIQMQLQTDRLTEKRLAAMKETSEMQQRIYAQKIGQMNACVRAARLKKDISAERKCTIQ